MRVEGIAGNICGVASYETVSPLDALLELDEMSVDEFGEALQACNSVDMVVIRPDEDWPRLRLWMKRSWWTPKLHSVCVWISDHERSLGSQLPFGEETVRRGL